MRVLGFGCQFQFCALSLVHGCREVNLTGLLACSRRYLKVHGYINMAEALSELAVSGFCLTAPSKNHHKPTNSTHVPPSAGMGNLNPRCSSRNAMRQPRDNINPEGLGCEVPPQDTVRNHPSPWAPTN